MTKPLASAAAVPAASATPVAVLMPGAGPGEWELCRAATGVPGLDAAAAATRQVFPSLEAAAINLQPAERFILALPVESGLIQRMGLPAAEPDELEEMARIQLEKILPFPAEDVGVALQEVSRTETGVVVALETIHNDRLIALCEPLVTRGHWPSRVVFQAFALAASAPPGEDTAFLYREAGKIVLGVCEGGRLSFAQALGAGTAEDVAGELPAVLLGAELEGVPGAFYLVRIDERLAEWQEAIAAALSVPVTPFDAEAAALSAAREVDQGDLSPREWKAERQRIRRAVRLRRRLLLAAMIYSGVLVLGFLWLGVLKFRVSRLDSQLAALQPKAAFARTQDARWKTMAPAVQESHYFMAVVQQIYECLPPGDTVRFTLIETPRASGAPGEASRSILVVGEAPSPSAAVDFTEKIKARNELKMYRFEADPPRSLPNGKAEFHITGTKS